MHYEKFNYIGFSGSLRALGGCVGNCIGEIVDGD